MPIGKKCQDNFRPLSFDPIENKEEGKAGWEAYVADKEQSAQRAAEAEAKKASEGYSWEQFWDDLGRWMGPGVNPDTSLPFHTDVQLIAQGYRDEEAAKRVPDERWTDEQRYAFGYIWKSNRQKAGDYAYAVNNILNIQQEQEQLQQIKEWSTANIGAGALSTAGAILAAPVGMADFLGDIIQSGTLGYIPEADGQITPFEFSQGVTSGISQHLNTEYGTLNEGIPIIGGKGWGDVYGLGTSIAQSSLAAATGGPGQALITFFGSAAAAGVDDAVSRGASADQAVAYGTMVGLAEALAEMIGVDNLMKIGSSATIKQLVWNILKQGAAEGIEEGVTSVLNNFADNLIMGDKSNFNLLVSEYMNQGMDEKDAKKKAWMNMAGDIAFDMLGGFVSGEVHAGPLTSISYVKTQNQYAKTGSSIMDADGGVEALMDLANQVAGVSSAQMQSTLTSQIDKVSQNPTARNVGQLYATVQTANNQANAVVNQADVAKSLRNNGVSAKEVDGIAAAIVSRLNHQELTRLQRNVLRSALNSSAVRNTISEFIKKKTDGIDSTQKRVYDNSNIRDIFTNEEKAALGNLSDQSVDALSNHAYATATEDSAIDQSKGASSKGVFDGGLDAPIKNIDHFVEGTKSFDDVLDDYAKVYADKINSNQLWSWEDTIPGGENLTPKQRSIIKQQAVDAGLIPDIRVTKVEGMRYGFADFESAEVVMKTQYLPENMWKMSDAEQFKWLNEQNGGSVEGYTWHHTETPGEMQLVPTGIHNITTHNGGRTAGMWADSPR